MINDLEEKWWQKPELSELSKLSRSTWDEIIWTLNTKLDILFFLRDNTKFAYGILHYFSMIDKTYSYEELYHDFQYLIDNYWTINIENVIKNEIIKLNWEYSDEIILNIAKIVEEKLNINHGNKEKKEILLTIIYFFISYTLYSNNFKYIESSK